MDVLIQLLIICAIFGIAWWALTQIPMPDPFRIVISVIFAIIAILLLCNIGGIGDFHWRRL